MLGHDPKRVPTYAAYLLAIVFCSLAGLAAATAARLYRTNHYTSDGFHYYSALRNVVEWGSFWEGPTFEYLLGNHSYVSLYLLAPLIAVWRTPATLAVVNTSSHYLAGALLAWCAAEMIKGPLRVCFGWLIGLLYVAYPLVVHGYYADNYLFQPDYLLAPLLALLLLLALKDRPYGFLGVGMLVVLTKEEYIPLLPIFALFVLHLKYLTQGRWLPRGSLSARRFLLCLACCYVAASGLSLLVLLEFRQANAINHAVRATFQWEVLTRRTVWAEAGGVILARALPLWPVLALALLAPASFGTYATLFYLAAFAFGRSLLNAVIYGHVQGMPWANVLVAPTLFMALLGLLGVLSQRLPQRVYAWLASGALLSAVLWAGSLSASEPAVESMRQWWRGTVTPTYPPDEIKELRAQMAPVTGPGYIITEEFLMGSFMERSHAVEPWLAHQPGEVQERILAAADYLVLRKINQLVPRLRADPAHFALVSETKLAHLL